jgi:TrmH family RNA methyltransferase
MYRPQITSVGNQSIKDLVRLKDRRGDRADQSFVVEGEREIERALISGFYMEDLFYCPDYLSIRGKRILTDTRAAHVTEVSPQVFSKIALRDGSDGLVAVFRCRDVELGNLKFKDKHHGALLLVAENVEKPGNLGALLRTADAVGADGVITLGRPVDPWNQNCIRASLGAVFSVPVVRCKVDEFFEFAKQNGIKTVAAALSESSIDAFDCDLRGPVALILGSEAHGISQDVLSHVVAKVVLPMKGICDSLNVSVAGGILAYEVLRQRRRLS